MAAERDSMFTRLRRMLGGRNSWRRATLAGIGGGLALAIGAALLAAVIGGGGSGSLDGGGAENDEGPISAVPVSQPEDALPVVTDSPLDLEPEPTVPLATEESLTPTPSGELTSLPATPALTPTTKPVQEKPTPAPTDSSEAGAGGP